MYTSRLIRHSSIFVFFVFAFTLFVKCILFHYFCFGYVAVSSLWQAPLEFFAFYFSKLFPAIFIASFIFIIKRSWVILFISFLCDFWLIANFLYFQQCELFINVETITMIGNLDGFWSSIATYINWKVFVFPFFTFIVALFVTSKTTRDWFCFVIAVSISLCLLVYDFILGYGSTIMYKTENRSWYDETPIRWAYRVAVGDAYFRDIEKPNIVERGTVFNFFPSLCVYEMCKRGNEDVIYTETENSLLTKLVDKNSGLGVKVQDNLIIVLIESFESWIIEQTDLQDSLVMPNLHNFLMSTSHFYTGNIKSQVRGGGSGDGQMIENTGLLPIETGAACMIYGENTYPNYAHFFENSIIIDPCANSIWNQPQMTKCYGYKDIYPDKKDGTEDDLKVMKYAVQKLDSLESPFCMHIITMSMHTPFTRVYCPPMKWPNDIPENLRNYLDAVHYTDASLGILFDKISQDSLLQNTTIIITGDHAVFKKNMLQEYQPFAQKYHYPVPAEESFCPLIVVSPNIPNRVEINEMCYQMDIFPTILHCIGVDDYYWKGFGVNLLDSTARKNRLISEEEAFILSDKMIRSNYFKNFVVN